MNAYCVSVIHYTAGIVKWTVDELKVMDRKTRKLLTIHRGLHPRSNVDHLYRPRKKGGRSLKLVEDVVAEVLLIFLFYLVILLSW